jgi:hypothetical protein
MFNLLLAWWCASAWQILPSIPSPRQGEYAAMAARILQGVSRETQFVGSKHFHRLVTGVLVTGVRVTGVRVTGVGVTGVRVTGVRVTGVGVTGVRVTGVRVTGVRVTGVGVTGVRVTGVRVTGVGMTGVRVTGVRVTAIPTPCPLHRGVCNSVSDATTTPITPLRTSQA